MFICSDNLSYIKTLDSNSIDLIYFDPPFNITEADYDNKLDWDNLWGEMWRVLKPRANENSLNIVGIGIKHIKLAIYLASTNL